MCLSSMLSFAAGTTKRVTKMERFKRPSKDEYYLNIALAVSKRSTCLKRHYGCVIVKDDVIVATGYNGSPRSEANCCDVYEVCPRANVPHNSGNYEGCSSVHAEQNAIIMANRSDLISATLYLVCEERVSEASFPEIDVCYSDHWREEICPEPCPLCMRMIKNAGIKIIKTRSCTICL